MIRGAFKKLPAGTPSYFKGKFRHEGSYFEYVSDDHCLTKIVIQVAASKQSVLKNTPLFN